MSSANSPFLDGSKFAGAAVGLIITALALYNLCIDALSLDMAPVIEPVMSVYRHYVHSPIEWMDVNSGIYFPSWNADLIAFLLLTGPLSIRMIASNADDHQFSRWNWFEKNIGLPAFCIAGLIVVPYARAYLAGVMLVAVVIAMLGPIELFVGRDLSSKPQQFRLAIGRYLWGCLLGASVLIVLSAYH